MNNQSNQPREKITEANMEKMGRYSKADGARDAHTIYLSNFAGDVATISHEESPSAGYPLGSVSPFFIDHTGNPVIFTASIAQHTKNALANPRTSLMMREVKKNHQIETGWRLTCMGDLLPINPNERERIAKTYFRHYPNAKLYEGTHDFNFYRLNIKVARVILGFGRIAWVDAESLVHDSPLDEKAEDGIITHMNDDHVESMERYLQQNHVELKGSTKAPEMVAVNQFGVTLSYRKRLHFISFKNEAHDAMAVREQLVTMAKA